MAIPKTKGKVALPSITGTGYKFTPPAPTGPKTKAAAGKTYVGAKSAGKPVAQTKKAPTPKAKSTLSAPKVKPTYVAPKVKPAIAAPAPTSYGGTGAYGKTAYTGAGSSGTFSTGGYGGARSGAGPTGGSYGSSASAGSDALAGPVGGEFGSSAPAQVTAGGGTPSQVAQLALSTLAGRGNAQGISRRRNRAGAGYNTSLSPEQLRNIAARRVGG